MGTGQPRPFYTVTSHDTTRAGAATADTPTHTPAAISFLVSDRMTHTWLLRGILMNRFCSEQRAKKSIVFGSVRHMAVRHARRPASTRFVGSHGSTVQATQHPSTCTSLFTLSRPQHAAQSRHVLSVDHGGKDGENDSERCSRKDDKSAPPCPTAFCRARHVLLPRLRSRARPSRPFRAHAQRGSHFRCA